jgi:hypothetical protein
MGFTHFLFIIYYFTTFNPPHQTKQDVVRDEASPITMRISINLSFPKQGLNIMGIGPFR